MHIVFVDILYGYTADRPEKGEALGGMTSAVCFLARELVKLGVTCTFVNLTKEAGMAHGIPTLPLATLSALCGDKSISAFIFPGRWEPKIVQGVKKLSSAPLIAWMHESQFNNHDVAPLPEFNGVVFVSEWQKRTNQARSSFRWKTAVIRNAMNPRFAELFAPEEKILAQKNEPPVLLYAGDFQRGAFHMPDVLKELYPLDKDFQVEIFTNTAFSPDADFDKRYFEDMRALPNVTHVGKVGQVELANRMKRAAILVMPNPWPETSCINLIQAMASGMLCVITDRAALPETAHNFARIAPFDNRDEPMRFNLPLNYPLFAEHVADALKAWRSNRDALEEKLQKQRNFFLENYQWSQRAKPWIDFLEN